MPRTKRLSLFAGKDNYVRAFDLNDGQALVGGFGPPTGGNAAQVVVYLPPKV